jgi:flagellar capping protein FliD
MDSQIASMQARLAIQRASLQREFTEADAAMSRLNSQSDSLATFGTRFGSF